MTVGRARRLLALAGAASLAACVELSGPEGDILSITPIQAAWPSVVLGDSLRDSTGAVRPLRVTAFAGNGDTVAGATVRYVDFGNYLRVDDAGRVIGERLAGDTAAVTDTVVATVGSLQTNRLPIAVVPRPDSAHVATGPVLALVDTGYTGLADPALRQPLDLRAMTVQVLHRRTGGSTRGVPAWVVHYQIVRSPAIPAGAGDSVRTRFAEAANRRELTTRDTTDASGNATRTVRLFPLGFLPTPLPAEFVDTVVVRATVQYRGQPLRGAESLDFVIPLRIRLKS